MSRGCARCSSPSNRHPCPASCRLAQPGVQQGKAGGFTGSAHTRVLCPTCPLVSGVHLGCAQVNGCNSPHGFPLLKRCIGLFLHLFITVAFPWEATLGGRTELAEEPPASHAQLPGRVRGRTPPTRCPPSHPGLRSEQTCPPPACGMTTHCLGLGPNPGAEILGGPWFLSALLWVLEQNWL